MKIQKLIELHYTKLAPGHAIDGDRVLSRLMAQAANVDQIMSQSVLDKETTCLRYLLRCLDEVQRSR